MSRETFSPGTRLRGTVTAPADKSLSHRAALLAAMTSEPVRVTNFLPAEDTLSTLRTVQALGVLVQEVDGGLVLRGPGLRAAAEPGHVLDVGNAGTLIRLITGWLAGQRGGGRWTLDGDASIRRRPMGRVIEPLRRMGARIEAREGGLAPLTIEGRRLTGTTYEMPIASAQVKSALLLAGILADGRTTVVEPSASRDHTERLLLRGGVDVRRDGLRVSVGGHDELEIDEIAVPGDPSSAAFLVTAAVLVPGSRIVVEDMAANWTRVGFYRILERMGGIVLGELEAPGGPLTGEEPVTELDVSHGPLVGTTVEPEEVPLAIDELPLVALLGCFAEGETVVRGAEELRHKESDRIETVVGGLRGLGADIEATPDGFVVRGTGGLRGGRIQAHGDHRLAMLGAVAGLASRDGVEVDGMDAAAVSYPGFATDLSALAGS
jgi:3-phosphoshikimate 1-carboxyvinyltransferase